MCGYPRWAFPLIVAIGFSAAVSAAEPGPESESLYNWPQWRGPLGTGTAPLADPPTEWHEARNIRWKTPLPGTGHSTPIVWENRVFITTALPFGEKFAPHWSNRPGEHDNVPVTQKHRFVVLAINRADGSIAWERTVRELIPHEGGHRSASLASASPVTDGERLIAYFGSHGLFCFDLDGELIWEKDLGDMHSKHGHGEGASPVLYDETLIVNWDHEEQSFLVAFDKATGEELWRVNRDEETSWSSPIVFEVKGAPQVIVPGTERVRGYDLADGRVIWQCGGLSSNIVATPIAANGRVFVGSSYEKQALLAVDLEGARGDVTGADPVLWTRTRGTPYVPSLLLVDDSLYFLRHYQNILTKVDAATGTEPSGPFRLGGLGNIYASPVSAAGRVYITDLEGTTLVLSHEESPRLLALNRLDEPIAASAAIAGRDLFLRSDRSLYCISAP